MFLPFFPCIGIFIYLNCLNNNQVSFIILVSFQCFVGYPSYFINVLLTYIIVLLPFIDIIFVFAFIGRLSNLTSRRIIEMSLRFLLSLMDEIVFGFVQTFFLFGTLDKRALVK